MSFAADVARFVATVHARDLAVHEDSADLAFDGIVHGSALTGAPGQPVSQANVPEAGKLRDSWTKERTGPTEILISTDVDYAQDVELNLRGFTFANHGPHSVALTVAGFPRIVAAVTRKVAGNG